MLTESLRIQIPRPLVIRLWTAKHEELKTNLELAVKVREPNSRAADGG